jgi:hypothetical protein
MVVLMINVLLFLSNLLDLVIKDSLNLCSLLSKVLDTLFLLNESMPTVIDDAFSSNPNTTVVAEKADNLVWVALAHRRVSSFLLCLNGHIQCDEVFGKRVWIYLAVQIPAVWARDTMLGR